MSFKHLNLAWKAPCMSAPKKLVLLKLADRANERTGLCWPNLAEISEDTGLCRRAVITAINSLVADGLIRAERNRGRTRHNNYWLTLSQAPVKGAQDAPFHENKRCTPLPKKVHAITKKGAPRALHCSVRNNNNQRERDSLPVGAVATRQPEEESQPLSEVEALRGRYAWLVEHLQAQHAAANRSAIEHDEAEMCDILNRLDALGEQDRANAQAECDTLSRQYKRTKDAAKRQGIMSQLKRHPFKLWSIA